MQALRHFTDCQQPLSVHSGHTRAHHAGSQHHRGRHRQAVSHCIRQFFYNRALCTHMRVCPKPAWPPAPPRCSTQVSDACRAVLLMTKRDLYDLCFEGFVDVEDRQNRPELVSLLQVGICM